LDAEHAAEHGRDAADTDVAKDIRLTPEELEWLDGLLTSRQVPATAMSLEMLDGFFTALVIGPETLSPSQYLSLVWGTQDGDGPQWDSSEQAEYALQLLVKHWNAIAARRMASTEHQPIIYPFSPAPCPVSTPADSSACLSGAAMKLAAPAATWTLSTWPPICQPRRCQPQPASSPATMIAASARFTRPPR
jgi:hypothetical protein